MKPTVKEQQAMKKQAQQVLKIKGEDYDEYIYSIHKEICVNAQDLIVEALEKEAKHMEEQRKRQLISGGNGHEKNRN